MAGLTSGLTIERRDLRRAMPDPMPHTPLTLTVLPYADDAQASRPPIPVPPHRKSYGTGDVRSRVRELSAHSLPPDVSSDRPGRQHGETRCKPLFLPPVVVHG
jgi:hypothetical protein